MFIMLGNRISSLILVLGTDWLSSFSSRVAEFPAGVWSKQTILVTEPVVEPAFLMMPRKQGQEGTRDKRPLDHTPDDFLPLGPHPLKFLSFPKQHHQLGFKVPHMILLEISYLNYNKYAIHLGLLLMFNFLSMLSPFPLPFLHIYIHIHIQTVYICTI